SPLHWSLMADVDDYGEWKTGKRITGISFSGNLFFLKLGLAIADNDALIAKLPRCFKDKAAPVWHLHESLHRLVELCREWPRVC
ncbi:MFS transporter, partial [Salmonella enterica subsp. enterica serovar Lubbock]|nr:MFS transporter [Salmonella enterica subsp. enterica serovar Lubbock]